MMNNITIVIPIYNKEIIEADLDCDGIIDRLDDDKDGDGVLNINDAFPLDATETLDTDNDNIGNNRDTDDDNDGLSDDQERILGTDPLLADSDNDSVDDGEDDYPLDETKSKDTTPPVITLLGSADMTIDGVYHEPGFHALDDRDGSVDVKVEGEVNYTQQGIYHLRYIAKDSAGNIAIKQRDIKVTKSLQICFLHDKLHNNEPWVTDGTPEGTFLLKDTNATIKPTMLSNNKVRLGNNILFTPSINGDEELWISDGTQENTKLLKNINPHGSSRPRFTLLKDGEYYFTADDGIHGEKPWKTDGTRDGTIALPLWIPLEYYKSNTVFNDRKFYTIKEYPNKCEVWTSNGTKEGTSLLYNKYESSAYYYCPTSFVEYNDKIYFATGSESIIATDGTTSGTTNITYPKPIKTILFAYEDKLYMKGTHFNEPIYRTDSSANFEELKDQENKPVQGKNIILNSNKHYFYSKYDDIWELQANGDVVFVTKSADYMYNPITVNNQIFFNAKDDEHGIELWVSDGTADGTHILKDINPGSASGRKYYDTLRAIIDDKIYFIADDGIHGRELWVSDGTENGTKMLADFSPGSKDSYPYLKKVDNKIVISTGRIYDNTLKYWISDSTPEGTQRIDNDNLWAVKYQSINIGKKHFYYQKNGYAGDIMVYDEDTSEVNKLVQNHQTESITQTSEDKKTIDHIGNHFYFGKNYKSNAMADSIETIDGAEEMKSLVEFGDKIYFIDDGKNERYLSRMDRDGSHIEKFHKLSTSNHSKSKLQLVKFKNMLYFRSNSENGNRLYKTDGTREGTTAVESSDGTVLGYVLNIIPAEDKLFFIANTSEYGSEIWVTDGTKSGTHMVKNIGSGSNSFIKYPSYNTAIVKDNKLYFSADDGEHGVEPWISDGTDSGTFMLKDTGQTSRVYGLTLFNIAHNKVFFRSNNDEIWTTDGTIEGTNKIANAYPNYDIGWSGKYHAIAIGTEDYLYFVHDDGIHGEEMWVSDGTLEGTRMLKDIDGNQTSSIPPKYLNQLTVYKKEVYFLASDGIHGRSIWKTNGTKEGTVLFLDAADGAYNLYYSFKGTLDGKLLIASYYPMKFFITDGTKDGTRLLFQDN